VRVPPPPSLEVTVVVPTYNRRAVLTETLEALAVAEPPANGWEAIVVDDGSRDDTPEFVPRWIDAHPGRIRFLRQENRGPAAARNHGAREARGRFLIFIDNDIVVGRDFVRRHAEALLSRPGSWVVGRVTHPPGLRATPFGRFRYDLGEDFHRRQDAAAPVPTTAITAQNLSLPAADFARLGGFDEGFEIASSEDWDLGFRARQAGITIFYHPQIVAVHNDWAVSLEDFCRRQQLYSISDVLLCRKHGEKSPRFRLVADNGPLDWPRDGLKLTVKKGVKWGLAYLLGGRALRAGVHAIERIAPDTALCRRAYRLALSEAIFRGVREGRRRYPAEGSSR
jgi:GT2 family glycosyltransferase